MTETRDQGLLTIGAVARATGLTASALRFYGDCGLLAPAVVDEVTGYRYYTPEQCARAVLIRRLRGIELPLPEVAEVLDAGAARAGEVLDRHVAELARRAAAAAAVAGEVRQVLAARGGVTVDAAGFARAVRQVVRAAVVDPELPVLAGVLLEVDDTGVTVTATDRYRLSTRSVAPRRGVERSWSAVVEAGVLTAAVAEAPGELVLAEDEGGVRIVTGAASRRLPGIAAEFPDYRAVLAGLGPARTRVLLGRAPLLAALEAATATVPLVFAGAGVALGGPVPVTLPATVTGAPLRLAFDPRVLRPAVEDALGPELMLDLTAPDQPVVLRSATDGDLTTLVMPVDPAH